MTRSFDPRLRVVYITDPELPSPQQLLLCEELLSAGIRAIQLRLPMATPGELFSMAEMLRELTQRHESLLLINDRLDVALASGADGCHLGRRGLPIPAARKIVGDEFLLGYSAHSKDEVIRMDAAGADYCSLSPIFPPKSKDSSLPPIGVDRLRAVAASCSVPLIALGGIEPLTVAPCLKAGAYSVAMIGALSRIPDPIRAVKQALEISSSSAG